MAVTDTTTPAATAEPRAEQRREWPEWWPGWARQVAELYFSGTTSVFVLTGNTYDAVPLAPPAAPSTGPNDISRYGSVAEFLAEQMFGQWDVVLHYDLGRGLRAFAGRNDRRLREMVELVTRRIGDLSTVKNDPTVVLQLLDLVVRENVMAAPERRLEVGIIIDQASYLFPVGEPGRLSFQAAGMAVTVLNWATSPHVKRLNVACVLIDERRSDVNDRIAGNPHVAALEIPLPAEAERLAFINWSAGDGTALARNSDYTAEQLAELTAGISLNDLAVLLKGALEGGKRLDAAAFRALKKRLIERQCQGLLEFIEPKWTLDTVIGHDGAKRRLREDAQLLARGALESVPMGYLLCGPVGTGKSFLATCAAGEMGIPCVVLKNFRSKYVGETEGNLERVLTVLRAMGPVLVVVDEADAALGDRDTEGDSGTSSRVFAMIATQMGDTRYRGRILWMLLTARPDLLPIDIKRQGRAEVHIPLFYPHDEAELRGMFVTMARKLGTKLAPEDVPPIPQRGQLSGADVEGIVGRAWRKSLLAGADRVTPDALAEVVSQFMPSTQGLEKELQETAALIECTDREFLPEPFVKKIDDAGGRGALQERLTALKQLVASL
jgi:AAA+ superfamily predicted ATPase